MVEKVTDTWISTPKKLFSAATREACLVHIYPTGPTMGCRYPLSERLLLIGRGDDCDIRLCDHSVSRKHARIEPEDDGYFVSDQQSTNGTFVNGRRIAEMVLSDEDRITIGGAELTVSLEI